MAQHTIDLPCILDTWIDEINPNISRGSETTIKFGYQSGFKKAIAFLKFDHSIMPKRKTIISCSLRVFNVNNVGGTTYSSFYEYDEALNWTESLTWVDVPYSVKFPRAYGVLASGVGYSENFYVGVPLNKGKIYNSDTEQYGIAVFWTKEDSEHVDIEEVMTIHSREGANPPMLRVVYEDTPPSKPTLNEPVGTYESSSSPVRFSWNYNSSVGGEQKSFNLQWSTDQSTWTSVSQTTANSYYDMPVDTLPAGNIYWRVQTVNEHDEASEYSGIAAFYSIGAPNAPIVQSVTNASKPIVAWAAVDQQVFRVQITKGDTVIYDSGDKPSIQTRSYQVPVYLADDTYTARIRIKNEYDMYSDWGEAEFTISVAQPTKPLLTIQRCLYGLELHVSNSSDKKLIYRNDGDGFICVAETGEWFVDYAVASGVEYEYFARTVNADGGFADSDIVTMRAELKNNLFAPVSNLSDLIVLKYNKDTIPAKTYTLNPSNTTTYYAGRTHAVTEFSGHEESAINFTFFVNNPETIRRFRELVMRGETVLFRDGRGRKIYGTLTGYSEVDDRHGFQISFVFAETDYNEEVEG